MTALVPTRQRGTGSIEARVERTFFQRVPIDMLMKVFGEAFKAEPKLTGLDSIVNFEQMVRVLKRMNEWTKKHLRAGQFTYVILPFVDQINENLIWEYNVLDQNVDVPIQFNIQTAKFDSYRAFQIRDITVGQCLRGIHDHLVEADKKIDHFNGIVASGIKPFLPAVNSDEAVDHLMRSTVPSMTRYFKHETGSDPGRLSELANIKYDSRVIGYGFEAAESQWVKDKAVELVYDVFQIDDVGWANIRTLYRVRGVGLRFILHQGEIAYYNPVEGKDIPGIYAKFIKSTNAAIHHWNWILKGGNREGSQVKNRVLESQRKRMFSNRVPRKGGSMW